MTETAPKRVLAIDYGRRRMGLALSDELGCTAQPLAILVRRNRSSDLRRLRDLCRERKVSQVVVGYPVHMSGEAGAMAEEAARFAARLERELGIPVDLQDERLTSWEAKQMAWEAKAKRGPLDDVAAAIVLREYLERQCGGPSARAKKD
ncbi:MAG TPA: Holliday junction resolvase RuvX [Candidatus Acidoferrales bacterium]|nr:Holliday junction resolvase RuvX [Candidatus Acidoferrales bacterium]